MKAYCIYKTIEIFYRLYPSTEIMRFFLYVQIPTEAGNDIVKDPYLVRNIEEAYCEGRSCVFWSKQWK